MSGDHLQRIEAQVERREDVCNENILILIIPAVEGIDEKPSTVSIRFLQQE